MLYQVQASEEDLETHKIMLTTLEEDHKTTVEILHEDFERSVKDELSYKDEELATLRKELTEKNEEIELLKVRSHSFRVKHLK